MATELTRQDRNDLISELKAINDRLYPEDDAVQPDRPTSILLREKYYQVKGEYADRLPRVVLSRCPFTGQPLKRAFDPFGLDGPWWHSLSDVVYEEPRSPASFQVLLGAVDFRDRAPAEVRVQVIPGPGAPFVVPRLLQLPGMKAVVGRIELTTGDIAYPIAYFSTEKIEPIQLHQPWCRADFWFANEDGDAAWSIANDKFDFDLAPWMAAGRLLWTDLTQEDAPVLGVAGGSCPFLDLPGVRQPQQVGGGEVVLMGLPTGAPVNPFD